ncbi:hypothetical protein TVAG_150180 [Trichomonas vaginalis G3]|uniref:Uncharacterized protein n=1 Tax=Trichomonas vaginalis (strain ATCC PRA-98 / G3) TaxID=412133 RepID=A2DRS0_TRIV3|nr:histone H3-K4 methylation [Trichomonas vaginalis G3]EAY16867.1 hypothetical protein TVAG_150180 [Trichomonas vaginalis G3]KAI5489146.1 histone H3-K4 methylation [Trichomonas vaginalis G3]|eukprot:XP_001329090.1 hypothetical protein [Trichomonas vaginalis G3]
MDLRVFFDEVFVELPNEYYADFDFETEITAMVLSKMGHILGLGFEDGSVILCDSDSGNNRHNIKGHKTRVSSVAFSPDNRLFVSGDHDGYFQVTDVITKQVVFSEKAPDEIQKVLFNPENPDEFLALYGLTMKIINLKSKEFKFFPDPISLVCWTSKYGLICVTDDLHLNFYDKDFKVVGSSSLSSMKKIPYMAVSNTEKLICLLNIRGEGFIWDVPEIAVGVHDDPACRNDYKDRVSEMKYTCCVFDRMGEHIIFSSNKKQQCKLVIYEIDATEVKQELDGPSDPVNFILFHPQQPVIYTAGTPSIRMWTPTYENSWEQFMPGFQSVTNNVEYQEREDEFDIDDSVEQDTIMRNEGEIIDIFTFTKPPPDILVDLPLDIDDIVAKRLERKKKEAEEEEKRKKALQAAAAIASVN